MGKTIGLVSLKGGVGKTTLSCALASDLAYHHGKRVLLVDANYSAPNLGIHMDIIAPGKTVHDVLAGDKISSAVHEKYGVHVVPGNFLFKRDYNPLKLKNKLAAIKKQYDFIILDASPSLNEEVLSTIMASDDLFIVSTADYPTLSCSMKAAKLAKQKGTQVSGIILNRVKGEHEVRIEEVQESTGIPVVARVREDEIVPYSLFHRTPATLFSKRSLFSKEVKRLSSALTGNKEKRSFIKDLIGSRLPHEQVNREVLRKNFYSRVFK